MGKVMSLISRKAQRFNVENRAQKVISLDKKTPAPKFESNLRDYQRVLETDPNFGEEERRKNEGLNDRLRQVYVTSTRTEVPEILSDTHRPLPLEKRQHEEFEFGYKEPDPNRITPGRFTLRQALQFISNNQADPKQWTSAKIASEYNLKQELVENILQSFKIFEIYIPDRKAGKQEKLMVSAQNEVIAPGKNKQE